MKWLIGLVFVFATLLLGLYLIVSPLPGTKARDAVGTQVSLEAGGATLVWHELGEGPAVIMFASLGREASDFNELAEAVAGAGYKVYLVEAPGINGARASKKTPTLFDLAKDLAPLLDQIEGDVVFLGHAYGNRLARTTATVFDDRTKGVALIAAGGRRPIPDRAEYALRESFNPLQSGTVRRSYVRYAFFAGNMPIPHHWMTGWHSGTARLQIGSVLSTKSEDWWAGGSAPMLVIAGMKDTIAPPEDTIDLLEAEFADRVTGVRLDNAGHAILPEEPNAVASAVLTFLEML